MTPDASLAAYGDAAAAPARHGTQPAVGPGGLSRSAWIKIATISLLMVAIFWPNLNRIWQKTNPLSDQPDAGNWQHAIAVPLIGLYYLYANREQLLAAPVRSRRLGAGRRDKDVRTLGMMFLLAFVLPCAVVLALGLHNSFFGVQLFVAIAILFANVVASLFVPSFQLGLFILIEGLAIAVFGIHPGRNDLIWDFGMIMTLFGVVLMLTGWDVMKVAWFPIVFLICALPWPGLVYSWIAGPLQTLAARGAVATLRFTGVDILRSGTKILMMVPNPVTQQDETRVLNVAEACAGLRSLMTFVTVAAAVGFLSNRPLWQKILITLSAVPIAIFCNVFRVTGQGLLDRYVSQEFAEGFAHQFVGVVMLIPAFLLILLVCWVLDHLFLDEVDEAERERLRAGAARGRDSKIIQIQRPALAGAGAAAGAGVSAAAAAPAVVPPPRPSGFPRAAGNVGPVARTQQAASQVPPSAQAKAPVQPPQSAKAQAARPAVTPAQNPAPTSAARPTVKPAASPAAKPQAAQAAPAPVAKAPQAASQAPAPKAPAAQQPPATQQPQQRREQL